MTTFLYIRLSSADKDLKFKTESESISNQRALLHRYIDTHPDIANSITEEFVDDGYSGTNADRPSFERMIERVKNGDADVIICKDFSRFFRDYVEIGDYLEKIFPFLGVRFISVNDGYDSADYKGTTAGMDVVMRYIVYSSYSRDLSQKIKTTLRTKQKKGLWVGAYAPYGYSKDPENKNHLVINPDTASIVRRIFELAIGGKTTSEIAVILNKENIPTPASYFKSIYPESRKFAGTSAQNCWNTVNVKRILRTKLYTGAMVSNTKTWRSIYNSRTIKNDESEWIVVLNCHEAIVTEDEYETAQRAIRKLKEKAEWAPLDYPMRSLVVCGVCGRMMSHYPRCKRKYYTCNLSALDTDTECPIGEKFYEDVIEHSVIQDLKEKLMLFVDNQKRIQDTEKAAHSTESSLKENLAQAEKHLKQKSYERKAAYERYVDELITRDDFLSIKAKLSEEEDKLKSEVDTLQNELKTVMAYQDSRTKQLADKAEDFLSRECFTNEMIKYFIDKVKLYSGNRIEIVYRFQDIFENLLEAK